MKRNKVSLANGLKGILAVKLILLGAVGLAYFKKAQFGERPLQALDTPKQEGNPENAPRETEVQSPAEADKESIESALARDPMADGTPGEKEGEPRRSFLANLLDLPPLDPENVKREEIARYLNLAEMKKEQVDTRLGLLKERELQLMKLEDSIENKIQKLEEERAFLAETLQKEKDVQAERLKHLVELYRKMEPKKAAPVFEGMHRDLAVGLFKLIEQKQITKILEAMSPAKAVELSEYFSRIRSAREYDVLKDVNQSLKAEFEECKGMQAH